MKNFDRNLIIYAGVDIGRALQIAKEYANEYAKFKQLGPGGLVAFSWPAPNEEALIVYKTKTAYVVRPG